MVFLCPITEISFLKDRIHFIRGGKYFTIKFIRKFISKFGAFSNVSNFNFIRYHCTNSWTECGIENHHPFGLGYFQLWPVIWNELDDYQKFWYGTDMSMWKDMTEDQISEWFNIKRKLNL